MTIPSYGETYTLDESLKVEKNYKDAVSEKYLRLELLDRIQTLQEEIEDMGNIVKDEFLDKDSDDAELEKINARVKELEQKIVEIIENK